MNNRIDWGEQTPEPKPQQSTRRRRPWRIRNAAEKMIGRDGRHYHAWAVADDRVIWVCPAATPKQAATAVASLVEGILAESPAGLA